MTELRIAAEAARVGVAVFFIALGICAAITLVASSLVAWVEWDMRYIENAFSLSIGRWLVAVSLFPAVFAAVSYYLGGDR